MTLINLIGMSVKYRADLYKIIDLTKPVVELGVAEGNFSRDMLNWPITKLYSVDAWQTLSQRGDGGFEQSWHDSNYKKAVALLKPFGERSVIIRGLTYEVASQIPDESLGLLYMDADHSYEGVMRDLEAWYPKVIKGGYISSHDYLSGEYGVQQAVKDFTRKNKIFEVLTIPENKPADAGCLFKKPC